MVCGLPEFKEPDFAHHRSTTYLAFAHIILPVLHPGQVFAVGGAQLERPAIVESQPSPPTPSKNSLVDEPVVSNDEVDGAATVGETSPPSNCHPVEASSLDDNSTDTVASTSEHDSPGTPSMDEVQGAEETTSKDPLLCCESTSSQADVVFPEQESRDTDDFSMISQKGAENADDTEVASKSPSESADGGEARGGGRTLMEYESSPAREHNALPILTAHTTSIPVPEIKQSCLKVVTVTPAPVIDEQIYSNASQAPGRKITRILKGRAAMVINGSFSVGHWIVKWLRRRD